MNKIPTSLKDELLALMTISRLVKTGLFAKLAPPTEEIRPQLKLYRTILDKALLDQFDKHEEYRLQSKLWADLENPDFNETCDLALLEPEDVLDMFNMVTEIFREKGEDIFWKKDNKKILKMSLQTRQYYLDYEEQE